mgnify:CR=1 FL=1
MGGQIVLLDTVLIMKGSIWFFYFSNFSKRRMYMILITKEEKDAISKLYPDAHIVRTMRQKSKRHRYYCEESTGVMKYLEQTRAVYGTPGQKDGAGIGHFKKKQ